MGALLAQPPMVPTVRVVLSFARFQKHTLYFQSSLSSDMKCQEIVAKFFFVFQVCEDSCFLSSLSSDFVFQVCEDCGDCEKMRLWESEEILNLPFLLVQRSLFGIAFMSCLRKGLSICGKARKSSTCPSSYSYRDLLLGSQQMKI